MNLATKKWIFLKISSVILLPLMLWFIINFVNVYDNDYLEAEGKDETFISRIREDKTVTNGLNMWIVSDNLLRGAALNAVEIAETLIKDNFYGK